MKNNEAAFAWNKMKECYERWSKNNTAPFAMANFIEAAKEMCAIKVDNPFVKEDVDQLFDNAAVVPNVKNEEPVVVTAVNHEVTGSAHTTASVAKDKKDATTAYNNKFNKKNFR